MRTKALPALFRYCFGFLCPNLAELARGFEMATLLFTLSKFRLSNATLCGNRRNQTFILEACVYHNKHKLFPNSTLWELGRVRLRHGPLPGSDHINASFTDVLLAATPTDHVTDPPLQGLNKQGPLDRDSGWLLENGLAHPLSSFCVSVCTVH